MGRIDFPKYELLIRRVVYKLSRASRWFSAKESACSAGDVKDMSLISGSGRSPGGGHGNLTNIMDRGAWWAAVHGVTESDRAKLAHALLCNKLSQTYYSNIQHILIVSQFLCVRSPDLDELGPLLQECSRGMWTRASVSSGNLLGEGSTSKLL